MQFDGRAGMIKNEIAEAARKSLTKKQAVFC
jgi:hypothetical protein